MATLTVRDLDDDVRDALRSLAASNGRSMEAEVREVLTGYVRARRRPTLLEATERFRRATGGLVGVQALPVGRQRDSLVLAVASVLESLAGRIWAFDEGAAAEYALIVIERRDLGAPITTMDAQIAAIARSRGLAVATRDVAGLRCSGLTVIDPWS